MIHCRPKASTYFVLGLIVLAQVFGLIYTLNHFATKRTYPTFIYLSLTVFLTLVILLILVKMMAGFKIISFGKDQIITTLPLRRKSTTYNLPQVLAWEEESVITNKREFKQLTLVFEDKNSFTISNHEHLNYNEFSVYLHKKLLKKKIKERKKP
ncbi:hypothetical protein [Cognataquiflexum rubidum]|jgi:type IV secretory pathway VirB3-like protein|uniref:hypothetical protein n=1 Tax=Cognataquiflexum rubidum TaxID=2922273 RepID=UPI001F13ACCD|nr:hypothetical protein [Cognataquiflexum rubidum]MCH6234842.1 hypothetical protein [Cognataquiflexum rubidum]